MDTYVAGRGKEPDTSVDDAGSITLSITLTIT